MVDDDRVTDSTTSTWAGKVPVDDRRLPRSAVAGVGVVGFLLLVVAARTDGYWQGLLINLGTGALLFVALEYVLYGAVTGVTKLVTDVMDASSAERWNEMQSWAEQLPIDNLPAVQRELQAVAPLPQQKLEELQAELAWAAQGNVTEQARRMRYVYVLADNYGVQPLRQVMASRGEASARPTT